MKHLRFQIWQIKGPGLLGHPHTPFCFAAFLIQSDAERFFESEQLNKENYEIRNSQEENI